MDFSVLSDGVYQISTGGWSIVPPVLALVLALVTKEVYSSLTVGVFTGMLIFTFGGGLAAAQEVDPKGPLDNLIDAFALVPQMMAEQIASNGALLLFLALLGALVMVIAAAGGSRAYGEWVSKHIRNARAAQLLTAVLGVIIFVDDYFNCLTVGAVMRPVTDRFRISHEKLAWLIDSTAAPICIIAPVSSWAVAVGGYLGDDGFTTFVQSIPYNNYALLTIFAVVFICILNKDFGPMSKAQADFGKTVDEQGRIPGRDSALARVSSVGLGDLSDEELAPPAKVPTIVAENDDLEHAAEEAWEEYKGRDVSDKGTVWDLVIPIVVLIVFSIVGMLYSGGFFSGADFATAVGEDPVTGLCIGVCVALLLTAIMFLPRHLTTLNTYVEGISEGVRSMVGAIMILVLAWSLGGCCRYLLGTGEFVSGFLNGIGVDLALLPVVVFVVAGFIGFAMGTSWGTIALLLPIVIGVFPEGDPLFLVAIGATLGGAVYGDHVSPISDTTILSSAGAQCNHLRHVATQLPYASMVAAICLICSVIAGFTCNPWLALAVGAVLIVVAFPVLCRLWSSNRA